DGLWLKTYISMVWILDTVHQAFLLHVLYMYFVKDPGELTPPQLLVDDSIICTVIDAMVQIIFVVRAWHLSNKNRLLTAGLVVTVIAQFTAVTVYFARARRLSNFFGLSGLINFERAMNITIAVTDIFITTTIIVLLKKLRSEFRRTNSMVDRLVAYTMSTGLVTALCAVGGLISGEVSRGSLVYVFFDGLFPKCEQHI
ncbi:uncharacterized protein FOMMEDRAFT_86654, partial [Fomitiporia mediterranea MF3/22]|uniref:uncharacterized protein n=1 Tax=Fomitiporia mediterranea (strain MF3/22) TaxID=694068 RepID=UPI0004408587